MNKALLVVLLLMGGAFAALIVDFTAPAGVISANYEALYAGADGGLVTVDFSGIYEPYAAEIDVAGLGQCWISDCADLDINCVDCVEGDPPSCPPECRIHECEQLEPTDAAFTTGPVEWDTIVGNGNAYDTHLLWKSWSSALPAGPWPPSWPAVPPRPYEGERYARIVCNDRAGNPSILIQDSINLDLVDPFATVGHFDGFQDTTTIAVTQAAGDWGVDPSGYAGSVTEVDSAAIGDEDVLGAWGGYTTADTSGTDFNYVGSSCSAYRFRHEASDIAGRGSGLVNSGAITKIDTASPGAPVVSSSTHPNSSQAYASQDPQFNWTKPFSCSGIEKYIHALNANSTYTPQEGTDNVTTATNASYSNISEATWWFHVRPKNHMGKWGNTAHFQINIDVGPPSPDPTTIASVVVNSKSQITVTATVSTDPSGVNYSLWETTGGGSNFTWQASNVFVDMGLAPNTQYCYRAKATDKWGQETAWTTTAVCDYTYAAVPGLVVDCRRSPDRCEVTIIANGNPGGTQYYANNTYGNGTDSGWITSTLYTDTSASPTQICYEAKAQNANGIGTDWSSEVCDTFPNFPVISGQRTIPLHPTFLEDLNCTWVITDADEGDVLKANVTWYRNGGHEPAWDVNEILCTHGKACYTSLAPTAADTAAGEDWDCSITAYDQEGLTDSATASATILNTLTVFYTDGTFDSYAYAPQQWGVFGAAVESTFQGSCGGCNRRVRLEFDNSASAEDLVGFPVMVKLTPSNIEYSLTGPDDIRFYDSDGTTPLPKEIEEWVQGGDSFVWVKVPHIPAGSTSDHIWAYYDCPDTSAEDPAAVWGNGYRGVWHLGEGAADAPDSTGNTNTGTRGGGVTATSGVVGGADNFDGSSGSIDCGAGPTLNVPDTLTVSAWVYTRDVAGYRSIITKGNPHSSGDRMLNYGVQFPSSAKLRLFSYLGGYDFTDSTALFPTNTWAHMAVTFSNGAYAFYINGAPAGSGTYSASTLPISTHPLYIGKQIHATAGEGQFFNGMLDEVRVSGTARSEDWIEATHKSTGGTFITPYAPEDAPALPPGDRYVHYSMVDIDQAKVLHEVWMATDSKWQITAMTVEKASTAP
ncbi:MAG: DUF2341 domain-containing protein [Candidatus Diapherotrites archaeon]|nr:DUF2341 domain-containing protein [Candidatus Diapherotrites archaeon]